jgi:hypothetical protein
VTTKTVLTFKAVFMLQNLEAAKATKQVNLIGLLNPTLRGWTLS